jgi:signal transduction histidine kinase
MGDANLFKEVLSNLISNAIDAVPSGGSITVATRRYANPSLPRNDLAKKLALASPSFRP